MTDANERIKDLMIRHLQGDLDVSEQAELQSWVDHSDENRAIFDQLSDPDHLAADLQEYHEARVNILDKTNQRLRQAPTPDSNDVPSIPHAHRLIRSYAAAAAAVLLLFVGT